jgi:hypothetical protein
MLTVNLTVWASMWGHLPIHYEDQLSAEHNVCHGSYLMNVAVAQQFSQRLIFIQQNQQHHPKRAQCSEPAVAKLCVS